MTSADNDTSAGPPRAAPDGRAVVIEELSIQFGGERGVLATDRVSFTAEPGELITIIGPSGCGKSTVLNAVASLVPEDSAEITGSIRVGDQRIDPYSSGKTAPGLGYVFQRDALMPWRTVSQNIGTGLEIRGLGRAEQRARIDELLGMVGLEAFGDYYPHQISGGMRQRTSLARTLAYDPDIILMDEPFGALDAQTRMSLQAQLIRIWHESQKTILFVTHDLAEAIALGTRVVSFSRQPGRIIQEFEVPFAQPRDPFALFGDHEFAEYQAEVWRQISGEFRGSGDEQEAGA